MSFTELVPKNGACVFGALVADFASFDMEGSMAVDDVTPYGSNVWSRNAASFTPTLVANIGLFLGKGVANSAIAFGTGTYFIASVGVVLTLDTGCTETFNGLLSRFRFSHARMRGFVPAAATLRNKDEIQEAWTVS